MFSLKYFYNHSNLENEKVLCYAEQRVFIQSHTIQRKFNDKTTLVMVESGKGKLILHNLVFNISSDDVAILDSTVSQFRLSGFTKSTSYIILEVYANDLLSILTQKKSCAILSLNPSKLVWNSFVDLAHEHNNLPILHREYIFFKTNELLVLMIRGLCEQGLELITNNLESASLVYKHYIDEHYSENLTIESMASTFHISTSNLSHTFKEKYGLSPINYLIKVRITIAMQLLSTTELSIREISDAVGYENSNYFSLLFKKSTGENPSEFRQKTRRHI